MAAAKKTATKRAAPVRKRAPARKSTATAASKANSVIRRDIEKKNAARRKAEDAGEDFVNTTKRKPKGASKIDVEVVPLDPDFAQALLDNTPPDKQRPLKKHLIDKYASDMLAGRWSTNGEPIQLSPEYELINGQHRCSAVVLSGVTLPEVVMETLYDRDAVSTLDQGSPRTLRDAMKMSGNTPVDTVVSAGILYENSDFRHRQISTAQKMQIVLSHPHLEEVKALNVGRNNAGFMAVATRALSISADDAKAFFPAVFGKEPLVKGEYCQQAHTLAQWFLNTRNDPAKRKTGESWKRECAVRAIYAWNAWRRGTSLQRSSYKPDNPIPDMV